jgi:L-tartrate/succinate antiporter
MRLLSLVLAALVMWIGGGKYADPALAAILVTVLMVIVGVVSWNDITGNAQAWNVLVWFATLVAMANGLAETGFVAWLGQSLAPAFRTLGATAAILALVGAFYLLHYLFASLTAHASALLPVFLAVAAQIPGVPPKAWALLLAYTLGLMGILTPYATGPSPIYYGSGYIKGKDFWRLGLLLGALFFAAYLAITIPWLRWIIN